jgi:uncharacterized protein with FMN-binding domain
MHTAGRTLTSLIGAAALALPVVETAAAAQTAVTTKKLAGRAAEAGRWGTVQVKVTVRVTKKAGAKKATLKFTDLGGSYSYSTDRSQYIMSQALPLLRQEFLKAQSANVEMISGATDTSRAFEASLQSALAKLRA